MVKNIFILLTVFFNLSISETSFFFDNKPLEYNQFSLTTYGNWCGGGHGGYQDCCNGKPCPSCNYNDNPVTDACLKECPPIDQLDTACVFHDQCCFYYSKDDSLKCSPEGNYCTCDCNLLSQSASVTDCTGTWCKTYRESLQIIFSNTLSCWYYDQGNQTCNTIGSRKYPIDEFC